MVGMGDRDRDHARLHPPADLAAWALVVVAWRSAADRAVIARRVPMTRCGVVAPSIRWSAWGGSGGGRRALRARRLRIGRSARSTPRASSRCRLVSPSAPSPYGLGDRLFETVGPHERARRSFCRAPCGEHAPGRAAARLIVYFVNSQSYLASGPQLTSFAIGGLSSFRSGRRHAVVISMLNSYSGWAAAGIGFTLANSASSSRRPGRLVGRDPVLHHVQGMNRSFIRDPRRLRGEVAGPAAGAEQRPVKQGSAEDPPSS